MRVAFLHDDPGYTGGAELTMAEFARAAPDGVEIADSLDCETVVVGNCVLIGPDLIEQVKGKRVVWYHNDLSPHVAPELRAWLDEHAEHVFCSPLQRARYGIDGELVPPAIDLGRFKPSRQVKRNGNRQGAVSVGAWQNPGKGQQALWEWARDHDGMDVYGDGPFAPTQPPLDFKGPLKPEQVPETLWAYETFVHLPWEVEPFGRCVVEAWSAGLDLVINKLVGARWWIEEQPERLRTAAEDFWAVVMGSSDYPDLGRLNEIRVVGDER